jgi:protoporphyrinogen oxidase
MQELKKAKRIVIIGGGITGLTAAYQLGKNGYHVTLLEQNDVVGGLAVGFKNPQWNWPLERAYHHLFTNDHEIIELLKEIDMASSIMKLRPTTATYFPPSTNNEAMIQPFDSPMHLFRLIGLPMMDKVRTALLLAFCKLNPVWQPLEKITAQNLFMIIGGAKAWNLLWEPLMTGKFGPYKDRVAASWFWARIYKRTPSLLYIQNGFQSFIDTLRDRIISQNGTIITGVKVTAIEHSNKKSSHESKGQYKITYNNKTILSDTVLLTTPTPIAEKLLLPLAHADNDLSRYFSTPKTIPHLTAHVLIIETKHPVLKNAYWLNINDRTFPFLVMCQHTNLINPNNYGGNHVSYIGNYLPPDDPLLKLSKEEVWKKYIPSIKKIASASGGTVPSRLISSHLFIAPYAQPVHEMSYSNRVASINTPLKGIFLANMDSIYPWDRGTNYAVQLGNQCAEHILREE